MLRKKKEVRTLWGQEFDIVKRGLAEDQVIAFVEGMISSRNDLLKERDHRDSLRQFAEWKVRQAEELASSIVHAAETRAAHKLLQAPLELGAGDAYQPVETKAEERRVYQDSASPALVPDEGRSLVPVVEPADTTSHLPGLARGPEESPIAAGAWLPTAEPTLLDDPSYEIRILPQDPEMTVEPVHIAGLLEYMERSQTMLVNGYAWSPALGWVITASIQNGQPVLPILLGIPEINRVAEEESQENTSVLPRAQGAENLSPDTELTSRKRLLAWLRSPVLAHQASD